MSSLLDRGRGVSVRQTEPGVSVQAFYGFEHGQIGDTTESSVDLGDDIVLTWGQVVAIAGDEYGSIDELLADAKTEKGKARLRRALEHDGVPGALAKKLPRTDTKNDPQAKDERTAEQEQDARYEALVVHNVAHFAAGGTAIETWSGHHRDALAKAVSAGLAGDRAAGQIAFATEAFGQHFLTDAFSGGHVRTPRAEILEWYSNVFGPKVIVHLVDDLRQRLVAAFAKQIAEQLPKQVGDHVPSALELATAAAVRTIEMITPAGVVGLGKQFGTYLAGAVSGTIHDLEGERGVWVSSVAHPTPWLAYGDNKLKDSPDSRAASESAVLAAKAQVDMALAIGERFRRTVAVPFAPPNVIYFGFNLATLDAQATESATAAADYLRVHPEAKVDLVGHTDPIGADTANDQLGMRRAEAIKARLVAAGVQGARVTSASRGEKELVTEDPTVYRLNRRVELAWGSAPVSAPSKEQEEADAELLAKIPPPYTAVLDHVPHAVAKRNVELEDWRWGSMPKNLQAAFKEWLDRWVKPLVTDLLKKNQLDPFKVHPQLPITLDPRAVATAESHALFGDPVAYLSRAFGKPAGP